MPKGPEPAYCGMLCHGFLPCEGTFVATAATPAFGRVLADMQKRGLHNLHFAKQNLHSGLAATGAGPLPAPLRMMAPTVH